MYLCDVNALEFSIDNICLPRYLHIIPFHCCLLILNTWTYFPYTPQHWNTYVHSFLIQLLSFIIAMVYTRWWTYNTKHVFMFMVILCYCYLLIDVRENFSRHNSPISIAVLFVRNLLNGNCFKKFLSRSCWIYIINFNLLQYKL